MHPSLNLPIHQRTALVTVETARAVLGVDAETIAARIDCGLIRWAWNIALGDQTRELRIWATEFIAPNIASKHTQSEVINAVIGTQVERLRCTQVAHILNCSGPTMLRLIRAGHLTGPLAGHTQHINRISLVEFLHARLIGSQPYVSKTQNPQGGARAASLTKS